MRWLHSLLAKLKAPPVSSRAERRRAERAQRKKRKRPYGPRPPKPPDDTAIIAPQ